MTAPRDMRTFLRGDGLFLQMPLCPACGGAGMVVTIETDVRAPCVMCSGAGISLSPNNSLTYWRANGWARR